MKIWRVILLCLVLSPAPCLAKKAAKKRSAPRPPSMEFRASEKGGVFPEIYRDDFASTLKEYPHGRFARAYHGERASLHRYFTRAQNVFEDDADNDSMGYVILKLLFGCGDFRFSRALETEDFSTRQAIGRLIDPLLTESHLSFPLTRSNYHYRIRRQPPRD